MKKLSLILIIISLFVLTSCISQNDYNKVVNDLKTTNTQLNTLESQYNKLKYDYEVLKEKYPLKDFKSISEAESWAIKHKRDKATTADRSYGICMTIQQEAENDGYRVWVNWDENDKTLTSGWVWMMTMINNNLYYWNYNDPVIRKVANIIPER